MQSPSRRLFLTAATLAAAGVLTACTGSGSGSGGSDGPGGAAGSGSTKKADPDLPLRTRAVAAADALLAQYDALPAGTPAAGAPPADLRAEVVKQRAALAATLPAAGPPAASTSPSTATSAAASTTGGPTGVAALAAAERTAAQDRLADLVTASPELARLLASVAAAGALHAVRLGDQTPLTVPADAAGPASAAPASPAGAAASPSAGASAPATTAGAAPLPAGALTALQAALAAEHAAVYGYGVIGARIPTGPQRDGARAGYAAHQARRDAWQRMLAGSGATPTAAAPGYQLPFAVPDAAAAGRLAAEIETRLTAVYADLVAAGGGSLRMAGATALRECVLQGNRWGAAASALPGLPDGSAGAGSGSPAASPSGAQSAGSGSPTSR